MSSPDAFIAACPSRRVVARIGEKWTLMIVVALADGPMRFGALRRRIEGVSQKVMTRCLRNLERDGLLIRTVYEQVPSRVEYELSSLGVSFLPIAQVVKAWAEEHFQAMDAHAAAFDRRVSDEQGVDAS